MGATVSRYIRDFSFLAKMVPALTEVRKVGKQCGPGEWNVNVFWEQTLWEWQFRPALRMGDQRMTFYQLDEAANKCARTALSIGLKAGDTIGIYMSNCIDYVVLLVAMAKIGVTCSLLNTQVTGASLEQCLKECSVTRVFCSSNLATNIQGMQNTYEILFMGPTAPFGAAFDYSKENGKALPSHHRDTVEALNPFLHIFTSGTTGLPKAARINHLRFFGSSLIFAKLLRIHYEDVIYCPLPFYHSSAIILGLGLSWHSGAEFVFRDKFSASEFWADCAKYNVTVVQYIGELCRYLVNTAPGPHDTEHKVRMAIGNGLRKDVWERFQARFKVPQIAEFYAATEGNFGFVNTENKVGAVGFLSPMIKSRHPGKIIKVDLATGEAVRDENGRCVECGPGEVGELVGMIDAQDVTRRFDGYTEKAATERKVMENVFAEGDRCFRSGDLLVSDEEGFLYFEDRLGDTFRWKGENVSTTEVEGVISAALGPACAECVVYGVEVPGCEGRAGMALVRPGVGFEEGAVYAALEVLPSYARPSFMRVTEGEVEVTATLRPRKVALRAQGWDLAALGAGERLLFRDEGKFTPLDAALRQRITSGQLRL